MNTGTLGENAALQHYISHGYTLAKANYRTRYGEIDLILQKGEEWIFAEVKTRGPRALARPGEWVNDKKQAKIRTAALGFLAEHQLGEPPLRFDVVEVWMKNGHLSSIHCIENAF